MIPGVDLSKWQPTVNYDQLAQAARFCIARAAYGGYYIDQTFDRHADGCGAAGIRFAAYHYVTNQPAAEQWKILRAAIGDRRMMVWLDVEMPKADGYRMTQAVEQLRRNIRTKYDIEPGIYTRRQYWNTFIAPHTHVWLPGDDAPTAIDWSATPLWVAWYPYAAGSTQYASHEQFAATDNFQTRPATPTGFGGFDVWQFSDRGDALLYGIDRRQSKAVDLNWLGGDDDDLARLFDLDAPPDVVAPPVYAVPQFAEVTVSVGDFIYDGVLEVSS